MDRGGDTVGDVEGLGRIEAIWIKRAHRGPMDAASEAELVEGKGIAGNVDRSRRRQVSILERESWARCMAATTGTADASRRRANILVSGISLAHTRSRVLRIGDARLAIGGELTPCERMEEVQPGLQRALSADWGGGVFAQVLTAGRIRVGDAIEWESDGQSR
jgi:MOSC domain-containing protein YiiM